MALDGIPNLLSGQNFAQNAGLLLLGAGESSIFSLLSLQPTWGIYVSGTQDVAIAVDSVVEMGVSRENPASNYRIESGSFASYNKVQNSRVVPILVSRGGTQAERSELLDWLEQNVNLPTTFDLLMPESALQNFTLVSYKIERRAEKGVTILYAQCHFMEIREVPALYYNSGTPTTDTSDAASSNDVPSTPTSYAQPSSMSASQTATAGDVDWQQP
jgi:hypothetical protein